MEEHFLKAFDIYGIIRWRRSQMCVKFCWINTLVEESETKTLSNPTKKKIVRTVFFHLCDLLPSLLSMANGDFDDEDNNDIYSTNFSSVKQLHAVLNGAFSSYLRMDICNSGIKQLYERSLRLSNLTKLEDLQPPLASILTDLKSVLSTESVH
ncbi:unnamed protein product [Lymnaea stagnalis]|uniref:Uncharacterized protein n=1 Tax=Lymnaea stagnalis TaxID=6523 RepID=A0AAV2I7A1_LYMST